MYTFQYEYTNDDHLEFMLCHYFSNPAYRKRVMMNRYLIPAMNMAIAILLGSIFDDLLTNCTIFGVPSAAWILFHRKRMVWNIRRNMKWVEKTGKHCYSGVSRTVFGEEKITEITEDSETSIHYSAIERIIVGKNALYLYRCATTVLALPFRVFTTEEEKEAFLAFIRQKTNAIELKGVTK